MSIYTTAAAKGAELLDEERPGWALEVNWQVFSIRSTVECVLGQLFESNAYGSGYREGIAELGLNEAECDEPGCRLCEPEDSKSVSYGFTLGLGNDDLDWDALHNAWLALAVVRGAKDVPTPYASQ